MPSGKTAYGKYSLDCREDHHKVAAQAEKDKLADNDIRIPLDREQQRCDCLPGGNKL